MAPTPQRDLALVISGARPDQGFDQPVPLRWPADPALQNLIQLGAAVAHPAGQGRPVQTGYLQQPPQPGTELRHRALLPCHDTSPGCPVSGVVRLPDSYPPVMTSITARRFRT